MSKKSFSVQIAPTFAVPFARAQHPDASSLNPQLRKLLLARAAEGERYRNPRPSMSIGETVFESEFRLFEWPDSAVLELRDFCWHSLLRTVSELNGYGSELMQRLRIFSSSWFHVTRHGGHFGLHNHAMASWSGVYCVDTGDGDRPLADSGLLQFVNPSATAAMFMDPGVANIKAPFNLGARQFKLLPGELLLFPSWLLHDVTPHRGPAERITVAFNAWFRLDPATDSGQPS